jgi:hypothetical protein
MNKANLLPQESVTMMKTAQHSVQLTWGTRRVILAFFAAFSFFRFDRESTLLPQAANASHWALHKRINQKWIE